jgi:SAM-dependent methyltransferase
MTHVEIAAQFRKPEGIRGWLISRNMEKRNHAAYGWVLPRIIRQPGDKILEIGYGTGAVLDALARTDAGLGLFGVDFSRVMFRRASRRCRAHIRAGRLRLACGDVLDYRGEAAFNIVFAMNVVYFWKDVVAYASRIRDLLAPGGSHYLYMSSPERLSLIDFTHTDVFSKYSLPELEGYLTEAGFNNISTDVNHTPQGDLYLVRALRGA